MNTTADSPAFKANIGPTSTPLQPNILRLHKSLLHYATVSTRIFYIQDDTAWDDFSTNIEPYNNLSSQELRNMFLNDVLPQVFRHKLPGAIKTRLELLITHPCFRRSDYGYRYAAEISKQLNEQLSLKSNVDFCLHSNVSKARTFHTLLLENDVHQNFPVGYNCQLRSKTIALFSSLLATDQELFLCQLHNLAEIHRRLRSAKQSFENTGDVIPYRSNIDDLPKCLKIFVKLKMKVCQTLSGF